MKKIDKKWDDGGIAYTLDQLGAIGKGKGVPIKTIVREAKDINDSTTVPTLPEEIPYIKKGLERMKEGGYVKVDQSGYYLSKPWEEIKEAFVVYDANRGGLLRKLFGSIFVVFGAGIILISKSLLTGNVIATTNLQANMTLILSFMLMSVGLAVLVSKK